MTHDEILACARQSRDFGFGTVVLQGGEDPGLTGAFVAGVVRAIKAETGAAITLSLGDRSESDLRAWREAGADRYLLRFETSNATLLARIHPPSREAAPDRLVLLEVLRELGYEVGSGVMVGIPGQTWDDLVADVELFAALDLDMIGVGPFVPHPGTPLGGAASGPLPGQVPADEETALRVLALARLACPRANIPATHALAAIDPVAGYEQGLCHGANVVMPNLTPPALAALYEIYPAASRGSASAEETIVGLERRIVSLGRTVGTGRGDSARGKRSRVGPREVSP
jgi:biotin synthase